MKYCIKNNHSFYLTEDGQWSPVLTVACYFDYETARTMFELYAYGNAEILEVTNED